MSAAHRSSRANVGTMYSLSNSASFCSPWARAWRRMLLMARQAGSKRALSLKGTCRLRTWTRAGVILQQPQDGLAGLSNQQQTAKRSRELALGRGHLAGGT